MNSSEFRFTLDLHTSQSQVSIPIMEGDTARKFYISLTDGGTPFRLENGYVAVLTITRPTKTYIQHFCLIENNTTIVYDFRNNPETAAVNGMHDCEVSIYDAEGALVSTPRFTMVVSPRVVNHYDIEITDEDRHILDDIIVSEAVRVAAETERVSAEEARAAAETVRTQNEAARDAAETERGLNETSRSRAEVNRDEAENRRVEAEVKRVASENTRVITESDRMFNETNRVAKESARVRNEEIRTENESLRVFNENNRVMSEATRESNEVVRNADETKRAAAEAKRELEWSQLKKEIENSSLDLDDVRALIVAHNANAEAHTDLRTALKDLSDKVNAVLSSDDETLDELNEIVEYIKSNKTLIDSITTGKVSVTDIVDNLTTGATNKPLSAAQGMALRVMIEGLTAADIGALPSDTPIPYLLSELGEDTAHRTVSDVEKTAWNNKSNFSGAYEDLSGKPSFGDAAAKNVDTTIVDGDNSDNLPTSRAVEAFVEGKGYKTTDTTYTFGSGDGNGQIKVTPNGGAAQNVDVKGLGSAAFTPSTSYDAAGSAAVVQGNLDSHTGNKANPHGLTPAQIGAVPASRTVNGRPLSDNITLNASDVGADPSGAAAGVQGNLNSHNTNTSAHSDLRAELKALSDRLNAALDSDDTTLDELSEIVAYIKNNKTLIDSITTSKVNVSDIVNDLATNVSNRPLSAAQGVVIKGLIDALQTSLGGKSNTGHKHTKSDITDFPSSIPAAAHAATHKIGGSDALSAADVGARPNTWTPSAADVGALPLGGGTMRGDLVATSLRGIKFIDAPSAEENASPNVVMTFNGNDAKNGLAYSRIDNVLPSRLRKYQSSVNTVYDPNTATETGFYYVKGSTNRPPFSQNVGDDYKLLVTAYSESWCQQIATDFRCDDVFYRRCENDTWTEWVKFAMADDIPTKTEALTYHYEDGTTRTVEVYVK